MNNKLSFVIPCYGSEKTISHVVSDIVETVSGNNPYEIICVNDCSPDDVYKVLEELAAKKPGRGEAWNVNFPCCAPEEFRGILYDRKPAQTPFFDDIYYRQERTDGSHDILLKAKELTGAEEGSDIQALIDGYISVGIIRNQVM